MRLVCKSFGGNPNSTALFYRENILIEENWADDQNNVTFKFETGGESYDPDKYGQLEMNYTVRKVDNGVRFSCVSWNPRLGDDRKVSESRIVDVQCE